MQQLAQPGLDHVQALEGAIACGCGGFQGRGGGGEGVLAVSSTSWAAVVDSCGAGPPQGGEPAMGEGGGGAVWGSPGRDPLLCGDPQDRPGAVRTQRHGVYTRSLLVINFIILFFILYIISH